MKLVLTKAISNGKLYTNKMAVGETMAGEVTDIKEGKFGPIFVMKAGEKEITVFPSGNLKGFVKDLLEGKKELNVMTTFTRTADTEFKGYACSQFTIVQGAEAAAETAAPSTATTKTDSVADKLAAIRAKRAQSAQSN